MKRILVVTDGSEGASRAIGFAAELAVKLNCTLLILNVIGGYELPGGVMRKMLDAQSTWFDDLLATNSAGILRRAQDQVSDLGLTGAILESRRGDPVPTMLGYAQEQQIDAIVIGKRGEGQLKGMLLGSISQKLVSLAPITVMVVP